MYQRAGLQDKEGGGGSEEEKRLLGDEYVSAHKGRPPTDQRTTHGEIRAAEQKT